MVLDTSNISMSHVCSTFYQTYRIPIGVFSKRKLVKLYYDGGQRLSSLYLKDAQEFLRHKVRTKAAIFYDSQGSCWCGIPLQDEDALAGESSVILFGPVQTGRNPDFPYDKIPEHSWDSFCKIAECLIRLISGNDAAIDADSASYPDTVSAVSLYYEEPADDGLKDFQELYECVRAGDLDQLSYVMVSERFSDYLDRVMPDLIIARTVFYFNLARTYHTALDTAASIQDLSPLITLYISEELHYKSLAAYRSGMQRMLYDFTRYVNQYSERGYSRLVNMALLYIQENLYTKLSMQELADHCMSSVSSLQHRFREETGRSVTDMIREIRIKKACYYLKYTEISCDDIAMKTGFCSQSYFIKQFKKEMGITPANYRESRGHVT